jgi:succinoglycan biosynthesis protein ExoA
VKISAIVAPYNEERHIRHCLEALLRQELPDGDFEIIVVDGMSTDGTRAAVRSLPEFGKRIRLIENRRRLQVYALNLGVQAARGEYVAFISAHAEYSRDYFRSCLEVMHRTGATAVGGVQMPFGEGLLGRAIAWCMSTPYGMGNARYRYATKEEEVDSLFCAFMRRDVLEQLGGFDERFPYDEDSDLGYRIRSIGGKLIVSPAIGVRYHVRRSLSALSRQMFRYGYWRRFTQLMHPGRVPLRVYAPAALVAAVITCSALLATPLRPLSYAVGGVYLAFLVLAAVSSIPRARVSALLVPAVLGTMHMSYGTGWWSGLLAFRSVKAERARG